MMQSLIKVLAFFDCESIRLSELASQRQKEKDASVIYITYKILILTTNRFT